jgi:RNA polymerase sigma-70 factor (TIGR02943 family)
MHIQSAVNDATGLAGQHQITPEKWVARYADYLYSYALARLNDDELARDLVQETFLAALEKKDGFRGDCSERTWLTAIMKYKVIDIYRKKAGSFKARDEYGTPVTEIEFFDADKHHWKEEHWPAPFGTEEHDPLHNKEFMNVLQRCLQKLPPLWISVFRMKHMDGEGTEMICQELRISSSNFWVIIHRAKVNLRSCLQKNWI